MNIRGFFLEAWRDAAISRAVGQHLLVDVAQRDDLDRRHLHQPEHIGLAVPSAADQAHAFRWLVRGLECITPGCRQRQASGTRLKN